MNIHSQHIQQILLELCDRGDHHRIGRKVKLIKHGNNYGNNDDAVEFSTTVAGLELDQEYTITEWKSGPTQLWFKLDNIEAKFPIRFLHSDYSDKLFDLVEFDLIKFFRLGFSYANESDLFAILKSFKLNCARNNVKMTYSLAEELIEKIHWSPTYSEKLVKVIEFVNSHRGTYSFSNLGGLTASTIDDVFGLTGRITYLKYEKAEEQLSVNEINIDKIYQELQQLIHENNKR